MKKIMIQIVLLFLLLPTLIKSSIGQDNDISLNKFINTSLGFHNSGKWEEFAAGLSDQYKFKYLENVYYSTGLGNRPAIRSALAKRMEQDDKNFFQYLRSKKVDVEAEGSEKLLKLFSNYEHKNIHIGRMMKIIDTFVSRPVYQHLPEKVLMKGQYAKVVIKVCTRKGVFGSVTGIHSPLVETNVTLDVFLNNKSGQWIICTESEWEKSKNQ